MDRFSRRKYEHDPWAAGAADVLGKSKNKVTREERQRFKDAFYRVFTLRGPKMVKDQLETLIAAFDLDPAFVDRATRKAHGD